MASFDLNADPDVAMKRQFAALLMKQGTDSSPVQHWTQGAARMANALVAGLAVKDMKDEAGKSRSTLADTLLGAEGAAQPAVMPQAPQPSMNAPSVSAPNKVYSNNEPSPLDPPAGDERAMMARMLQAEAGNQGSQGMQAVADVIRNRAVAGNFGGNTPSGVMQAPKQFEGLSRVNQFDPNNPQAQAAIDRAYGGAPSAAPPGATHFYAPKAQAALGRPAPSWDNGKGVDVGDHRFFGGVGTPAVTAGATDMSAQSRQPAMPQAQRTAPQIPDNVRAQIRALIMNPATTQFGLEMASKYMQPSQPTLHMVKDADQNEVPHAWNPTTGALTRVPVQGSQQASQPVTGLDGNPINVPPGQRKFVQEAIGKRRADEAMPGTFEDASRLRGEVRSLPSYKALAESVPAFNSMVKAAHDNSRASDLHLVYSFGKLMDPGSVVREGEMLMVNKTSPLSDMLQQVVSRLNGGTALTPETRAALVRTVRDRMTEYKARFDMEAEDYRGHAARARLKPEEVIPTFGELPDYAPKPPAQQRSVDDLLKLYGPR